MRHAGVIGGTGLGNDRLARIFDGDSPGSVALALDQCAEASRAFSKIVVKLLSRDLQRAVDFSRRFAPKDVTIEDPYDSLEPCRRETFRRSLDLSEKLGAQRLRQRPK